MNTATTMTVAMLDAAAVKLLKKAAKGLRIANDNTVKMVVATDLNIFAMRQVFGAAERVSNRLTAVDVPHIRRCVAAGLVVVEGSTLVLTAAGKAAV